MYVSSYCSYLQEHVIQVGARNALTLAINLEVL